MIGDSPDNPIPKDSSPDKIGDSPDNPAPKNYTPEQQAIDSHKQAKDGVVKKLFLDTVNQVARTGKSLEDAYTVANSLVDRLKEKLGDKEVTAHKYYSDKPDVLDWVIKNTDVKNPDAFDAVVKGVVGIGALALPGVGVARGAKLIGLAERTSALLGIGTNTVMMSAVNAGNDYRKMVDQGASQKDAEIASAKTFAMNLPLDAVFNSFIFSKIPGANKIAHVLKGAGTAGAMNGMMQLISNANTGEEDLLEGVGESAGIGAIAGVAIGGLKIGADSLIKYKDTPPLPKTFEDKALDSHYDALKETVDKISQAEQQNAPASEKVKLYNEAMKFKDQAKRIEENMPKMEVAPDEAKKNLEIEKTTELTPEQKQAMRIIPELRTPEEKALVDSIQEQKPIDTNKNENIPDSEQVKSKPLNEKILKDIRQEISDGYSEKGNMSFDENGKVISRQGATSYYPEYFQRKGFTKTSALNAIDKYIEGKPLTDKQDLMIKDLYHSSGYEETHKEAMLKAKDEFKELLKPGSSFIEEAKKYTEGDYQYLISDMDMDGILTPKEVENVFKELIQKSEASSSEPSAIKKESTEAGKETVVPKTSASILRETTEKLKELSSGKKVNKSITQQIKESFSESKQMLSEKAGNIKDLVSSAGDHIKRAKEIWKNVPKTNDMREAVKVLGVEKVAGDFEAKKFAKEVERIIPDKINRSAIKKYLDAGGDETILKKGEKDVSNKANIYKKAQNLTPEEKQVAERIKEYSNKGLELAKQEGVLEDGIENYIKRIVKSKPGDEAEKVLNVINASRLKPNPDFAKQRQFDFDYQLEKLGYKIDDDPINSVISWHNSMTDAIASRQYVKTHFDMKASDGRPLIKIDGKGLPIKNPETGETEGFKIKPHAFSEDQKGYEPFNHPAFKKLKWVGSDDNGKPIFLQGDVLIHPEAIKRFENMFGRSVFQDVKALKFIKSVYQINKQTLLDLTFFHPANLTGEAIFHGVMPWRLTELNMDNPVHYNAVKQGLVVNLGIKTEGLGGGDKSLVRLIPGIGNISRNIHRWAFEEYIPKLKITAYEKFLKRNMDGRYKSFTEQQIQERTASEVNASFGGLNLDLLGENGRSKTMQDILGAVGLAPDFLEARVRAIMQAGQLKGGILNEQRKALVVSAIAMWTIARTLNMLNNEGDPHNEPENVFRVVIDGKAYGFRSHIGDIVDFFADPHRFVMGRLNPTTSKPLLEWASGRDYAGRKRTMGEQVADYTSSIVPMGIAGYLPGSAKHPLEAVVNAFGVTSKRYTDLDIINTKIKEWKKDNNIGQMPGEFIYDPRKDSLAELKKQLITGDDKLALHEFSKLSQEDMNKVKDRIKKYAHSALTGSLKHDKEFYDSLSDVDKAKFKIAQMNKKLTYDRLKEVINIYQQEK